MDIMNFVGFKVVQTELNDECDSMILPEHGLVSSIESWSAKEYCLRDELDVEWPQSDVRGTRCSDDTIFGSATCKGYISSAALRHS